MVQLLELSAKKYDAASRSGEVTAFPCSECTSRYSPRGQMFNGISSDVPRHQYGVLQAHFAMRDDRYGHGGKSADDLQAAKDLDVDSID